MDFFKFNKRQSGRTLEECRRMAQSLLEGYPAGILAIKEDNRIDDYCRILKEQFNVEVEVKRCTRKEPQNPIKHDYNQFGEIINTSIVKQHDKFIGWMLHLKK